MKARIDFARWHSICKIANAPLNPYFYSFHSLLLFCTAIIIFDFMRILAHLHVCMAAFCLIFAISLSKKAFGQKSINPKIHIYTLASFKFYEPKIVAILRICKIWHNNPSGAVDVLNKIMKN